MRILLGYEMSGINREAFKACGWDAWSCDLQKTLTPGQHIQGDISEALKETWDFAIFNPPCQYIAWSGMSWSYRSPERMIKSHTAVETIRQLYNLKIPHICIENSFSPFLVKHFRRPTQSIHPYHFGVPEKKSICLWLKNIPALIPTNILPIGHRFPKCYMMPDTKSQSFKRSLSYPNVAKAMAEQWTIFCQHGQQPEKEKFRHVIPALRAQEIGFTYR